MSASANDARSWLVRSASTLLDAYLDRSAEKKVEKSKFTEWLPAAIGAATTAIGNIGKVKEFVSTTFGLPSQATSSMGLFITAMLTWVVIATTVKPKSGKRGPLLITFSYSQPLRHVAKAGSLMCFGLLIYTCWSFAAESLPISRIVYGYVRSSDSDYPVSGARVRVYDTSEDDVTLTEGTSDARGFFVVETTKNNVPVLSPNSGPKWLCN